MFPAPPSSFFSCVVSVSPWWQQSDMLARFLVGDGSDGTTPPAWGASVPRATIKSRGPVLSPGPALSAAPLLSRCLRSSFSPVSAPPPGVAAVGGPHSFQPLAVFSILNLPETDVTGFTGEFGVSVKTQVTPDRVR